MRRHIVSGPAVPTIPVHNRTSIWMKIGLVGAVLLATLVAVPSVEAQSAVHEIVFPIHTDHVDNVHYRDTWGAARSGGRSHIGVDIMGPKMTPVVAVADGVISWGRFDNARGTYLKIVGDDGWEYAYIHLNNDTPGTDDGRARCDQALSARICSTVSGTLIGRGTPVSAGEVIGYIGDSGNAENTGAHLHFEVYQPSDSGTEVINPTPIVDAAKARIGGGSPSPAPAPAPAPKSAPEKAAPGEAGFVDHAFYVTEGRRPTRSEVAAFDSAVSSEGDWAGVATLAQRDSSAAKIDRLYAVYFNRYPDNSGLAYWVKVRGRGASIVDIAQNFGKSAEYNALYTGISNGEAVDRIYRYALRRESDESGRNHWIGQLKAKKIKRRNLPIHFAESPEIRQLNADRNQANNLSLMKNGRVATNEEIQRWVKLKAQHGLAGATARWFGS